jgi:hypothetical protein
MKHRNLIQGKYTPLNKHKYKGDCNNIIYRSSYELQFMNYCDLNSGILEWSSEETIIPYISPKDGKYHRYFVDFWIKYVSNEYTTDIDGNKIKKIKKALIEIKPDCETRPPKETKRITETYRVKLSTFFINQAKWQAAFQYAKNNNMDFEVLTEKWLKNH